MTKPARRPRPARRLGWGRTHGIRLEGRRTSRPTPVPVDETGTPPIARQPGWRTAGRALRRCGSPTLARQRASGFRYINPGDSYASTSGSSARPRAIPVSKRVVVAPRAARRSCQIQPDATNSFRVRNDHPPLVDPAATRCDTRNRSCMELGEVSDMIAEVHQITLASSATTPSDETNQVADEAAHVPGCGHHHACGHEYW